MYNVDEKYVLDNFDDAIANDHIKPFFQPIMRTLTGEICAAETLARWEAPGIGLLPPAVFIDVLEKHRLIHKLDLKILDDICRGCRKFADIGVRPLPFSVNLSRLDFDESDFFENVISIFEKYDIPHDAVHLEITESVTLENTEKFTVLFERFRNAGFEMWLDDFGSGYTSLNVLKDYEFDLLKIDMRFLSNIGSRSKILIESVVNTAKALGIQTLAEGVEIPEQVEFLKNIGCEMLQGYYYAKPMSPEDFERFITDFVLPVELPEEREYRKRVGQINFLSVNPIEEYRCAEAMKKFEHHTGTRYPLALMELEDDTLSFPYINSAYLKEMAKLGLYDIEAMQELVNDRTKPYFYDTKKQIESTVKSEAVLKKDYVMGDICYSFTTKFLAKTPKKTMIAINLVVFGEDGIENRFNEINKYNTSLFYNFELVNIIKPDTDESKRIYSNYSFNKVYGSVSLRRGIKEFADSEVYPDDRQRYLAFMDLNTLDERILRDDCSFVQQPFRLKTPEKDYIWRLVRVTRIPTLSDRCYMYSIQRMAPVDIAVIEKKISEDPGMFG